MGDPFVLVLVWSRLLYGFSRHRRGSAETSLAAGGAPSTDSQQERQGLEKKRKLNPLETLLMVYTQASARTDARPDRQYPFFTGLPLKPYFDRYARKLKNLQLAVSRYIYS